MDPPKVGSMGPPVLKSNSEVGKFLDHIVLERRLSPHTLRNYLGALSKFHEWLDQDCSGTKLIKVNTQIARSYLVEIQNILSRKTLANQVSALRSFYQFCQLRGWTKLNPFKNLSLPKPDKPLPKFLTQRQASELMSSPVIVHQENTHANFLGTRDRIALELLYGTGLRVSEVVALNYSDIDFSSHLIRVKGKGNKERICPMVERTSFLLKEFRKNFSKDSSLQSAVFTNLSGKRLSSRWITVS